MCICDSWPLSPAMVLQSPFADLSDRHRAEARVRDRERQFVTLANAMPQLVWTERPDGTHEYFNRGWYAYTGLSSEDSSPTNVWTRILHPDDEQRAGVRVGTLQNHWGTL